MDREDSESQAFYVLEPWLVSRRGVWFLCNGHHRQREFHIVLVPYPVQAEHPGIGRAAPDGDMLESQPRSVALCIPRGFVHSILSGGFFENKWANSERVEGRGPETLDGVTWCANDRLAARIE